VTRLGLFSGRSSETEMPASMSEPEDKNT